ncbi:uncharacterized protein LOC115957808 [Quercus lobata]|uniref:uncharacterized protein LOC115957808 n=1 Tax=Quercus lobata TaxID=97700 RepID=UPI001245590E|nr:uncharacterized protein LOC115957808 [Quercus lobata]
MTRAQQRKDMENSSTAFERRSKVPVWNPTFDLDDSPLREDASISDFDSGRAGYIANTVEQALLLPRDMDELRNLKKHELFLSVKKDLALATQAAHVVEEWVDQAFRDVKKEEFKCLAAQKS